jgi:hypothetical protein
MLVVRENELEVVEKIKEVLGSSIRVKFVRFQPDFIWYGNGAVVGRVISQC